MVTEPESETCEIEVPAALLAALKPKKGVEPQDLYVESLRPSLFARVARHLAPKRRARP